MTSLTDVALKVGANRIVRGGRFSAPCGLPGLGIEAEREFRRALVGTALRALTTPVAGPTVFEPTPQTVEGGTNDARGEARMTPERAVATIQIDNARVRVTEWRFAPGTATGHHRHEFDYVVVPLTTGRLTVVTESGEMTAELVTGHAYSRLAGVEHDVRNPNPFEFAFVEIEIK